MLLNLWRHYLNTTPQRVKLIDVFMAFLLAVGGLQFVYCVLVGNYVRFPLFLFFHCVSHFLGLGGARNGSLRRLRKEGRRGEERIGEGGGGGGLFSKPGKE